MLPVRQIEVIAFDVVMSALFEVFGELQKRFCPSCGKCLVEMDKHVDDFHKT